MSDQTQAKTQKSRKKQKGRKAPGMLSFVVWRQFFMVLAAPGVATSLTLALPAGSENGMVTLFRDNFLVMLVAVAVPALVHGQLWKWSFDWYDRGPAVLRNLRIGQVALGALHSGLVIWALVRVATGEAPWEGAAFYYGLAIAGLMAGLWETIRPALEIKDPPEVKYEAELKARRAARRKQKKAEEAEEGGASEAEDSDEDSGDEEAAENEPADDAAAEAAPTDPGAAAEDADATDPGVDADATDPGTEEPAADADAGDADATDPGAEAPAADEDEAAETRS